MENITVQYLVLGILGVMAHSFLKAHSLSQYAKIANLKFNFYDDYIKKDVFALLASLCSVIVWLLLFKEVAAKYKSLQEFALTSFFIMGAMGSYVLQLVLSRAKKQITKVIDIKTNVADGIIPPVTEGNKEGVKVIKDDANKETN